LIADIRAKNERDARKQFRDHPCLGAQRLHGCVVTQTFPAIGR
jgi:hypothetical protein